MKSLGFAVLVFCFSAMFANAEDQCGGLGPGMPGTAFFWVF